MIFSMVWKSWIIVQNSNEPTWRCMSNNKFFFFALITAIDRIPGDVMYSREGYTVYNWCTISVAVVV